MGYLSKAHIAHDEFIALMKWRTDIIYKYSVVDLRNKVTNDEWFRADGDCICSLCNKKYSIHPVTLEYNWLNLLCDGTLVKL